MIAIDTNILVYAHFRESQWHEKAYACVKDLEESADAWAIPWPCLYEFYAIVTNKRIYRSAASAAQAVEQIKAWCESPSLTLISELSGSLPEEFEKMVLHHKLAGGEIHDAKVAFICVLNAVEELWTHDRDFSKFPGLKIRNPL